MMLGSMVASGVQGSQKSKQAAKLAHKTGEEQGLFDFSQNTLVPFRQHAFGLQQSDQGLMTGMREAANPGLMSALPEVFSQRPNSSQLDAVAAQQKQLENKALATGSRGGLLRQQMFEAAKSAAQSKLAISENARQNALQRAFGVLQPAMPTQNTDIARGNQILGYNQLQEKGLGQLAQLGVSRNMGQMGNAAKDAEGAGSGLGSILGGMNTGGGMGGLTDLITGLFGGGGAKQSLPVSMMGEGAGSLNYMIQ